MENRRFSIRRVLTALAVALLALLLLASAAYPEAFARQPHAHAPAGGWDEPQPVPAFGGDAATLPFIRQVVFDTRTGALHSPGDSGYSESWWRPGSDEVISIVDGRLALYDASDRTVQVSSVILDPAFGSWSPDGAAFVAEGESSGGRRTYLVDAATGAARQVGEVAFSTPWSPGRAWLAARDGLGTHVVFESARDTTALRVPIEHRGHPVYVRWTDRAAAVVVAGSPATAHLVRLGPEGAEVVRRVALEPGIVVIAPRGRIAVVQEHRTLLYPPDLERPPVAVAARRNPNYRAALWSPRGDFIALPDGKDLLLVEAATGRVDSRVGYTVAERWDGDGALIGWVWPCLARGGAYVRIEAGQRITASDFASESYVSPDGRWVADAENLRLRVSDRVTGDVTLEITHPQGFTAFNWSEDSRYLAFRAGWLEHGGPCVGDGPLGP